MNTDQGFSYTGSSDYFLNNIPLGPSQIALFDTLTGHGGIDYIPYDGSTVTLMTGIVNADPNIKNLEPSLNNKVYYLISDVIYDETQKDLIISLATEIPVSLVGGRYEGTFIFSNPNEYENLYLIWDYTDNLNSGFASYSGDATEKYISIDYGSVRGLSGINYNTTGSPTRYVLKYNDRVVYDTGYIGLNSTSNYNDLIAAGIDPDSIKLVTPLDGLVDNGSGLIEFNKSMLNDDESVLYVHSPLVSASWNISKIDTYLKPFYIDLTNDDDSSSACGQVCTELYYHDGIGGYPVNGDRIFLDSSGEYPYDGSNAYHLVSETVMVTPPASGGTFGLVDTNGYVILSGGCDCLESAVPFVYQTDITIKQDQYINIPIQATGNPTSWKVSYPCNSYTLSGGDTGSIFEITDCYGNIKQVTVGNRNSSSVTVCSSTGPTLLLGNGTYVDNLACLDMVLPEGLSFNYITGEIYGTPTQACDHQITVSANNCVGQSLYKTINIKVNTGIQLTPFAVDVENFGDTGDVACAVSPIYSLLYHNGVGRVPTVNDTIYTDYTATTKFMGGGQWYKIDHSTYSIKICETGNVCEINECPSVTTTTTSTTTTTTTTTLPTGDWYEATLCPGGVITGVLVDTTSSSIGTGNYIKTLDGNCWYLTATTTSSFPYVEIDTSAGTFTDCIDCLGITTTTTTTTTTTAPVYTGFMITSDPYTSSYNACMNDIPVNITLYHNGIGTYPGIGDFVYSDSLGTTIFNGGGSWYYFYNSADYTMQISNTGQVLNVIACAGVTTTTTTTTLPITKYNARLCDGSGLFVIQYQSFVTLPANQVVKCDDNICYKIISVNTVGTPIADVVFLYAKCEDCIGITTTTTTTSTTTTTTSTTTTTTTTIPPLTGVFFRYGSYANVCKSPIGQFFIDGPAGVIGNSIYEYTGGVYVLAAANYYLQTGSIVAYEWDGSNWTGNSTICA